MSLCVCYAHCDVVARQYRQARNMIRFHPFFFFLFRLVDPGRTFCRDGRAKRDGDGMGMNMRCDYDTRANYCIISAT